MAGMIAASVTPSEELKRIDIDIASRFEHHRSAEILTSMPGFGPVLAATFLAQIGGNLDGFDNVDRRACVAGLAPVPRDSGRISGNLHRPPPIQPPTAANLLPGCAVKPENSPASRAFYDRKRAEDKSHKQALIALARRRINVMWAMLRDHTHYREPDTANPALAA